MAVDTQDFATIGHLGQLATKTVQAINDATNGVFKGADIADGKLNFYTSATTKDSTTKVSSVDIPEEIFLDQAGTTVVNSFAWSAVTYPGSTNPNLEGKVVLVLAVKGDKQTNPTVKYSFVDLSKLVDVYTAANNTIDITNNAISVKVSAVANNAITTQNDGLHVDISGKADKVTGATAGNIATLDANGNIVDSGRGIATDSDVTAYLNTIFV